MDEMYLDLLDHSLGGVGLVDGVASRGISLDVGFWSSATTAIRDFFIWFFTVLPDVGSWIRTTPFVLALVGIFFFGFCFAVFARIYHSI